MKATDLGEKNPLRCPKCDDYRYLEFKSVGFNSGSKGIAANIPHFKCKNCNTSTVVAITGKYLYDDAALQYYKESIHPLLLQLKEGEKRKVSSRIENKRFSEFRIKFKYNSADYYTIPGLYRKWDEGFLCPVFFTKDLLLYYNNHSDYRVTFASYSRFHILDKQNESIISHGFGINRSGKIICWLGDLHKQLKGPKNKIHRDLFYAFNVASDHDIVSDYYFNQIESNWMSLDNEQHVFLLRNEFDFKIAEKLGVELTHIKLEPLIEAYKHPIINETDQINSAFIKLNNILIESLDTQALKSVLREKVSSEDLKSLKGLKLFEKFVISGLNYEDGSSLVSPMYILYDLRLLAGHIKSSSYEERLQSCKERLGIDKNSSLLECHNTIISKLINMYKILLSISV